MLNIKSIFLLITSVSLLLLLSACEQKDSDSVKENVVGETQSSQSQNSSYNRYSANVTAEVDDVTEQWTDFVDTLTDYTASEREQAIEAINAEKERLDTRIESLDAALQNKTDSVSSELMATREKALTAVKQQQEKLEETINNMQSDSSSAWSELKDGFSDAYMALGESIDAAEKQFNDKNAAG